MPEIEFFKNVDPRSAHTLALSLQMEEVQHNSKGWNVWYAPGYLLGSSRTRIPSIASIWCQQMAPPITALGPSPTIQSINSPICLFRSAQEAFIFKCRDGFFGSVMDNLHLKGADVAASLVKVFAPK